MGRRPRSKRTDESVRPDEDDASSKRAINTEGEPVDYIIRLDELLSGWTVDELWAEDTGIEECSKKWASYERVLMRSVFNEAAQKETKNEMLSRLEKKRQELDVARLEHRSFTFSDGTSVDFGTPSCDSAMPATSP